MREHAVVGDLAFQHAVHRAQVDHALADKDRIAEKILVNIAARGKIRIRAALPREDARKKRRVGRDQVERDPRLQNAVAGDDAGIVSGDGGPV